MNLSNENGSLKLTAARYNLVFLNDKPYVIVLDGSGDKLAEIFVLSSIHSLEGRDDTTWVGTWEVDETTSDVIIRQRAGSSLWQKKTYEFTCSPERFSYGIEVEGKGVLVEANYFGGFHSAEIRWGSGFFWSGQNFLQGFNPEPNSTEKYLFLPGEGASIGLTGVPLPGRGDWFFTPPPFCFCFKGKKTWLGLGVEAEPGHNRFTEYSYHAKYQCFYLSLAYDGQTRVEGKYRLPKIGFDFGKENYQVLEAHVQAVYKSSLRFNDRKRQIPGWWQEPIFCGWGEQSYLASREGGKAPDYSEQQRYEKYLAELESHQVSPGIVVLDDKWQAAYGENRVDEHKWPDLPGFIRRQHALGRKVLLWLKAWDPDGIPGDECITNSAGQALAVDPTNPDFEKRLRASVGMMVSHERYGADGFKIDFTARIPSSPGARMYGDLWGLELMKQYLWIIYDEAKKVKPDALIMTHTPHPYLADVTDMIRLNDVNINKDINPAMERRARVAAIACPKAIIDTDNWPMTNKAAWRKYLRLQPELGVPSLYFSSHIDNTGEVLTGRDYSLIRKVWARHRQNILKASESDQVQKNNKKKKTFNMNFPWQPPRWWKTAP
jgi:hypothetical protein